VQGELALARMAYTTWKRQVTQRYQPLHEQAEEVAEISRAAFREGGMDLLHLLDAERLRVEAQTSWVEALASYHQSVLSLEYAQGIEP
jgi:outer membrane protein, heavy metal efflux system